MTDRCSLRMDLAHPPLRADVSLAGPLDTGEHRIVVGLGTAGSSHAWRFTVGEPDEDQSARRQTR